jgi:hypothetical protein
MAGMIPTPPQGPRTGFPLAGLMVAIVGIAALIAYWIGGTHGMLMAAIYYGVVVCPVVFALILVGVFRRGFKRPTKD